MKRVRVSERLTAYGAGSYRVQELAYRQTARSYTYGRTGRKNIRQGGEQKSSAQSHGALIPWPLMPRQPAREK